VSPTTSVEDESEPEDKLDAASAVNGPRDAAFAADDAETTSSDGLA